MKINDIDQIAPIPDIFGKARPIAQVVDDLDAAIRISHEEYGFGPFLVTRDAAP